MLLFSRSTIIARVRLSVTPWTAAHQASLSFTSSRSLLRPVSIESVMPSNHLILVAPFSTFPQSFPASGSFPMIWLLASGVQSIRASAVSPSSKSSGLISFKIDQFDLLAVQGTLLQHHSSEASILRHSAFFLVQLSHPYMTTEKTSFD